MGLIVNAQPVSAVSRHYSPDRLWVCLPTLKTAEKGCYSEKQPKGAVYFMRNRIPSLWFKRQALDAVIGLYRLLGLLPGMRRLASVSGRVPEPVKDENRVLNLWSGQSA